MAEESQEHNDTRPNAEELISNQSNRKSFSDEEKSAIAQANAEILDPLKRGPQRLETRQAPPDIQELLNRQSHIGEPGYPDFTDEEKQKIRDYFQATLKK